MPSNEGRGYVLRRLVRRAVRHAWALGATDLVTPGLVEATVAVMGEAYPAVAEAAAGITETAEREEVRFRRTLEGGYSLLERELDGLDAGAVVPGGVAFRLHDTYGFPVELTAEIAAERGFGLDRPGLRGRDGGAAPPGPGRLEGRARRGSRPGAPGDPRPLRPYRLRRVRARSTAPGRILSIVREGEAVEQAGPGDEVEVYRRPHPVLRRVGRPGGGLGPPRHRHRLAPGWPTPSSRFTACTGTGPR